MKIDTQEYINKVMNRYNFMSGRESIEVGEEKYILTDMSIIKEMYNLIEDDFWRNENSTILDISCKSAGFLVEAYRRFMIGLEDKIPNVRERHANILINQLWGIATCNVLAYTTRRILYNKWDLIGNIFEVVNHNMLGIKGAKALLEAIEQRCFKDMKFDVVVGNPPYNRGMDLDFVNLGFNLCTKYCLMVTPAKWQTAADDYRGCASKTINYKGFREKLVPHMSHVVFYTDAAEVFEIQEASGVSYFLLDKKHKHEKCTVVNRSSHQKYFNNTENERSILNGETLNNIGNKVVEYVKQYKKFKFNCDTTLRYKVYTNTQVSTGDGWGYMDRKDPRSLLNRQGQFNCVGVSTIVDSITNEGMQRVSGTSKCIFSSGNVEECKSFVSWLNSKFTRFFVAINISKLTGILTDNCFRFVQAPPPTASGNPWDHIYTDEELYKYFKLPQEYIDVIESLIKERK